jgi:hypothetical protein
MQIEINNSMFIFYKKLIVGQIKNNHEMPQVSKEILIIQEVRTDESYALFTKYINEYQCKGLITLRTDESYVHTVEEHP